MWLPTRTIMPTVRLPLETWPPQTPNRQSGTRIVTNTSQRTLRPCRKENRHERELREFVKQISEFFFIRSHQPCGRAHHHSPQTASHSREVLPPPSSFKSCSRKFARQNWDLYPVIVKSLMITFKLSAKRNELKAVAVYSFQNNGAL